MELRESESNDWWPEASKEEQESLEKGIEDAEAGKLVNHSEVRKIYEKWLSQNTDVFYAL